MKKTTSIPWQYHRNRRNKSQIEILQLATKFISPTPSEVLHTRFCLPEFEHRLLR